MLPGLRASFMNDLSLPPLADFSAWLPTYFALTAIVALRYVATSGAFYWWLVSSLRPAHATRLMSKSSPPGTIKREIVWSLLSSFIYAAPATLVLEIWLAGGTAIYTDWFAWPIWYIPVSVLIYLCLHDTYFYWSHRLMHHKKLYASVHKVHHLSRPPTAWASFSFHTYESLILCWVVPILILFVPIHLSALLFVLAIMTISAVLNHCGWELLPERWVYGWPGSVLITATHHNLHHKHYNCNYGLYFRAWDKLMNTDSMGVDGKGEVATAEV